MSAIGENINYFIEVDKDVPSRHIVTQIASFFAEQFGEKIVLITKSKITPEDAQMYYKNLSESQLTLITFMYCKNYQTVLDKLLEMDSEGNFPKVILIESLHQWYNGTTNLDRLPMTYSTIIGALQDLVNVNSRNLKQTCFSFVTSDISEIPASIVEIFYGKSFTGREDQIKTICNRHRNPSKNHELS